MIKLDLRKSEVREIQLSQGKVALVDAEDYEELSKYSWYASSNGVNTTYAVMAGGGASMHRKIMEDYLDEIPDNLSIDHRNTNGLDNRKTNLRLANKSQQAANSIKQTNCSSVYKGVTKFGDKWISQIMYKRTHYHLGLFEDETIAAIRYDVAALFYFGEFARLNFPEYLTDYKQALDRKEYANESN